MMIVKDEELKLKKPTGYMLRLSARETGDWARRAGAEWPCSKLRDKRLWVAVDSNGLYDYAIGASQNYHDIDSNELAACVADHLPDDCQHLWPSWK